MSDHNRYMAAANRLARRNQGLTGTNPSVACLLVDQRTNPAVIVASGITAEGGRPHAEPIALQRAGDNTDGTTAYVTLEPCAHHGATPPCAEALIAAGVATVVTAVVDPDVRVSGRGHTMLRDAGIEIIEGVEPTAAENAVEGYLSRKNRGIPFVTLKLAMTPKGIIGIRGQGMVPITGPVSRAQVHLMRARHDAILIGAGTARNDNPELTCRLPGMQDRSPVRVVLDSNGTLPVGAKLSKSARQTPTFLAVAGSVSGEWRQRMSETGCNFLICDLIEGKIALPELLEDLALRGISSVMVEGGAKLAGSLLDANLVDAIELFIGPDEIDGEIDRSVRSPVTLDTIEENFKETGRWVFENTHRNGDDIQIRFERKV